MVTISNRGLNGSSIRAAVALASTLVVLAACTGDDSVEPETTQDQSLGTVVVGLLDPLPENLLPLSTSVGGAEDLLAGVLPSAFHVQHDLSVARNEDLLTEEPTVEMTDAGQQVVNYTLNPEAVWSDGTAISAADFEFTWRIQRTDDPTAGGCPAVVPGPGYSMVESVFSVNDGATVSVTFRSAFSDWRQIFAHLLPAHLMDNADVVALCDSLSTGWPLADGLPDDISGGPWQLAADAIDTATQSVTLTPNPEYWGPTPRLGSVTFRSLVASEPETITNSLAEGEIQLVTGSPNAALGDALGAVDPQPTATLEQGASFDELVLNIGNVHLVDPLVRRAVTLALDRAQIAESVAGTSGISEAELEPLESRLLLPGQDGYGDSVPEEFRAADPESARAILADAGYVLGADGVYSHPERGRLSLAVSVAEDPLQIDVIDVLIEQGAQSGIEVINRPSADLVATLQSGIFDAALLTASGAPYVLSAAARYVSPAAGGTENYGLGSSPAVDAIFTDLAAATDASTYAELANRIDALLWADLTTVPLYRRPVILAVTADVDGVEFNPVTGVTSSLGNWSLN